MFATLRNLKIGDNVSIATYNQISYEVYNGTVDEIRYSNGKGKPGSMVYGLVLRDEDGDTVELSTVEIFNIDVL